MTQSADTIAKGAKEISDGGTMKKMVFDPVTGDFTMIENQEQAEGHVVDEFARDGFAA